MGESENGYVPEPEDRRDLSRNDAKVILNINRRVRFETLKRCQVYEDEDEVSKNVDLSKVSEAELNNLVHKDLLGQVINNLGFLVSNQGYLYYKSDNNENILDIAKSLEPLDGATLEFELNKLCQGIERAKTTGRQVLEDAIKKNMEMCTLI